MMSLRLAKYCHNCSVGTSRNAVKEVLKGRSRTILSFRHELVEVVDNLPLKSQIDDHQVMKDAIPRWIQFLVKRIEIPTKMSVKMI